MDRDRHRDARGKASALPLPQELHEPHAASIIARTPDYTSRSMARATRATRAMTAANRSGLSDCGPSDSASSGLGCTSMMSPSAPAATAAMAIASTYSQWPVPWLGSTTTGRWVSFLSTGTALRSSVKRVAVSNVDAALAQDDVGV